MLHREEARARAVRDADLRVDVLDVVAAVFGVITSCAAISLFDIPRASRPSTSTSRAVRPAGPSRRRPTRCPATREHRVDGLGVEPTGAHLRAQLAAASSADLAGRGTAVVRASPGRRRRPRGSVPRASDAPTRRGRADSPTRRAARGAARRSRPSGASDSDWCSMRSVRCGASRTRSHSLGGRAVRACPRSRWTRRGVRSS